MLECGLLLPVGRGSGTWECVWKSGDDTAESAEYSDEGLSGETGLEPDDDRLWWGRRYENMPEGAIVVVIVARAGLVQGHLRLPRDGLLAISASLQRPCTSSSRTDAYGSESRCDVGILGSSAARCKK